MATLSIATAKKLVRKNLDELEPNGSVMYQDEYNDNQSLDDIIARNLPEAINAVHKAAPVQLLQGENVTLIYTPLPPNTMGGVCEFTTDGSVGQIMRVVACRAADSVITLTDYTPEASVEGQKQNNPYIRGTYDRPVLVRCQSSPSMWRYYSLKDTTENTTGVIAVFQAIYQKEYNETTPASSYFISSLLQQNIIDYLTALVMETYNDQRAQGFFTRANQFAA